MKIVILVLIGVYATTRGVFNEKGLSDLGRLVYNLSLPSLVFSNILTEVRCMLTRQPITCESQ